MKYYLEGHDLKYAAEEMLYSLLPAETWEQLTEPPADLSQTILSSLREEADGLWAQAQTAIGGDKISRRRVELTSSEEAVARKRAVSHAVKKTIYQVAVQIRGEEPAWGALTGVRPVKMLRMLAERSNSREEAAALLQRKYWVSPERLALAQPCLDAALAVQRELKPNSVSVYIGIPFCPSRCSYCSFVSHSIEKAGEWIAPYLEVLREEISQTAKALKQTGREIFGLYVGGGTPTTLTADQLTALLVQIQKEFDLSGLREFTVEAGRPDTITAEKLAALKAGGVDRISINPQSLNPRVLENIGRRHTVEQFYQSVALARETGFSRINMDLIAGLPGDTAESFSRSVRELIRLSPENITIHTLAAKRGADRAERAAGADKQALVGEMLDFAGQALWQAGYHPYYLYRQKFMAGGFENTGWCKPGTDCLYNICMMEEIQDIISLGAGGVTKLCSPEDNRIQRIANPKYPYEYVRQRDRILAAKEKLGKGQ